MQCWFMLERQDKELHCVEDYACLPKSTSKKEETRKPVTTGSTVFAGENSLLLITTRALCSSPTYSDSPTITRQAGVERLLHLALYHHQQNSNTIICTYTFFDITQTFIYTKYNTHTPHMNPYEQNDRRLYLLLDEKPFPHIVVLLLIT